jgi:hypothetical protein
VPRIPDALAHSVGFLYPSVEAAEQREAAGGTGFFVSVTAGRASSVLVVSNLHIAAGGCNALGLNTADGKRRVVEIPEWTLHPDGDDIAAAVMDLPADTAISAIRWTEVAATRERLDELNVGVGDEIIMVGRFIAHDGRVRNAPLARFGNIAMMPGELVTDARCFKVEAFLIEMRSLSGFSGSPVFVYLGPGTYRGDGRMIPFYSETIGLIGIDTGHMTASLPIRNEVGELTELKAEQNSGVAIVAPAWKIGETIADALGAPIDEAG